MRVNFRETEVLILHKPKFCVPNGCRDRRFLGLVTIAFGLGLITASICPYGLTLFIAAVILVAMGISIVCG